MENIFLIIKKFFYFDYEIFLWEFVFNVVDVINKLCIFVKCGDVKGDIGDIMIEILLDVDV